MVVLSAETVSKLRLQSSSARSYMTSPVKLGRRLVLSHLVSNLLLSFGYCELARALSYD